MRDAQRMPVALVAGAAGIIGHEVAWELKRQGWTVRGIARRAVDGLESIIADLNDADATAAALHAAADSTHLFYAALAPDADLAVEAEQNARMLGNLLDGLEAVKAPFRRAVIYQGFKIYGIHLGAKVRIPARESDPPHMPPNIYLAQESQLRQRSSKGKWDYVVLRPDLVVGDVYGNPMNIGIVVGVFAEISRALGIPMRFPGSDKGYERILQFTDAGLLARASVWAALCENAAGEAFNITNGDVTRWERVWEDVAKALGLNIASPIPLTLERHMADKGPLWADMASRYSLVESHLDKVVSWRFGDKNFHTETDVISDVNKIYNFGFSERMDSSASIIGALQNFKQKRILPPT